MFKILCLGASKHYEKGYIFPAGKMTKLLLYIKKGAVRNYYHLSDTEITVSICCDGEFASSFEFPNIILNSSHLEALEPLDVIEAPKDKLLRAYANDPMLEHFGRLWAEYQLGTLIKNYQMLSLKGSSDRYNLFLKWYPHLEGRVPLKYIAALLKIDQATLSRVRGKRNQLNLVPEAFFE